jgi:hypothetical protein
LLLTFIAIVCIAGIQALGDEANSTYDDAAYTIETADSAADEGATPGQPGKRKRPKKPKP